MEQILLLGLEAKLWETVNNILLKLELAMLHYLHFFLKVRDIYENIVYVFV